MSGVTADNPYRVSGVIAAAAAGGLSWQAIETGSTMTAEAGNAYWIDTTSNACTITLPSSASNGDEIIFVDYDRTWGTNAITLDSNGLNYQGDDDSFTVEYGTDGQALRIVYSGATTGWIPILDKAVEDVPSPDVANDNGIFGWGYGGANLSSTELVSNVGVVGADVTGVGTARHAPGACEYGGDKAIVAFGSIGATKQDMSNLISNTGVVGTDVTGVGTARSHMGACDYGGDKGIFAFGNDSGFSDVSNLVSNVGVIATDVTSAGTAKKNNAATEYSAKKDKGIFAYGVVTGDVTIDESNLVSNVGVIASDTTGVGTDRYFIAACRYGTDTGIFGYGTAAGFESMTNLVSNVGVVSADVTGVGTDRSSLGACEYGQDKGVFAFGNSAAGDGINITNLVSNTGVVATDGTDAAGTGRYYPGAASYN
jgi:hypothetical protein